MEILSMAHSCASCEFMSLITSSKTTTSDEALSHCLRQIRCEPGDRIIEEGHTVNELLYLHKGLIKLFKEDMNSKDQIIYISKPGELIGLLSIFSAKNYNYSITALEPSIVCLMDIVCFKEIVQSDPGISTILLKQLSGIIDEIMSIRFDLNKKQLRGRIAYILLYFSNSIYKSDFFTLPLTRKEVAEMINMTQENVIRILSEFRKDGIIAVNGKDIRIINRTLLEKIALHG